jgi:molecular chaperone DnaK (HSP70)
MGKSIAIDLGTTNSVVAVLGSFPNAGRVFGNEVTVISDERGNVTFPSVVAYSADRRPPFIVGHVAKQRIKLRRSASDPLPIATVKRYMGTDTCFPMGGTDRRPEEISGMILYFLIDLAERRLGEQVDHVLITVPAHFGHHETRLTVEATEIHANQLRKEQNKAPVSVLGILKEPIAAAYAYGVQDARPTLRVLVYDLGGGTFDVSVLEKRDGAVTIVDFGGDRQLGGHNFDNAIANKLLSELAMAYSLDLDLEAHGPAGIEDQARYAKLLDIAERAKVEVSGKPGSSHEIHESDIFSDKSPDKMPVNIQSRDFGYDELSQTINGYLNETVDLMWSLLDRAKLVPGNLDEVLLVGGSTKLRRILEKLALPPRPGSSPPPGYDRNDPTVEHFRGGLGKEPKLFSPDLAVAVGAAYYTQRALEETAGPMELKAIPSTTPFPKVVVEGNSRSPEGNRVRVQRHDGKKLEGEVDGAGAFRLELELLQDSRNRFEVLLVDAAGNVLAKHVKEVAHRREVVDQVDPPPIVLMAFLSHDLWLDLAEGDAIVAKRGEVLPKVFSEDLVATHRAQSVVLHLYEGRNKEIADLSIPMGRDFAVPAGHPLVLRGRIGEDEKLACELSTMINGKEFRREIKVSYRAGVVRDGDALDRAVQELRQKYQSALAELDVNDRAEHAVAILERLNDCEKELNRPAPDRLRVEQKLLDVQGLLDEVGQLARWKRERARLWSQLDEAVRLAGVDSTTKRELEALRKNAEDAYASKDGRRWGAAEETLRRHMQGLREKAHHGVSTGVVDTPVKIDHVAAQTLLTRRGNR